ncbi:MAG: hypothetical protein WCP10_06260 [Desulfuromonadales bacterium]
MICIVQNDPAVPPGLVSAELDRLGAAWKLVHPYREELLPPPSDTPALIVMGGSMGANGEIHCRIQRPISRIPRAGPQADHQFYGRCERAS